MSPTEIRGISCCGNTIDERFELSLEGMNFLGFLLMSKYMMCDRNLFLDDSHTLLDQVDFMLHFGVEFLE